MLKKAASGVLALLSCSRTESTLRATFLTPFPWLLTSIATRAFMGYASDNIQQPHQRDTLLFSSLTSFFIH